MLRKTLTPLEEARAVEKMLADGYTLDGAAIEALSAEISVVATRGSAHAELARGEDLGLHRVKLARREHLDLEDPAAPARDPLAVVAPGRAPGTPGPNRKRPV